MDIDAISSSVSKGLAFERSRVELATLKISMANVDFSTRAELDDFASKLRPGSAVSLGESVLRDEDVIKHYDPASPKAGEGGFVYRLRVDPTHEMATLVSATRTYEANIRAYNVHAEITRSALAIGRSR